MSIFNSAQVAQQYTQERNSDFCHGRSYGGWEQRKRGKPGLKSRFKLLVKRWKSTRSSSSDPDQLVEHRDYVAIQNLGPRAVPWIIEEFLARPDLWDVALENITGERPPNVQDLAGDLIAISEAWQHLAIRKGWIRDVPRHS